MFSLAANVSSRERVETKKKKKRKGGISFAFARGRRTLCCTHASPVIWPSVNRLARRIHIQRVAKTASRRRRLGL